MAGPRSRRGARSGRASTGSAASQCASARSRDVQLLLLLRGVRGINPQADAACALQLGGEFEDDAAGMIRLQPWRDGGRRLRELVAEGQLDGSVIDRYLGFVGREQAIHDAVVAINEADDVIEKLQGRRPPREGGQR